MATCTPSKFVSVLFLGIYIVIFQSNITSKIIFCSLMLGVEKPEEKESIEHALSHGVSLLV